MALIFNCKHRVMIQGKQMINLLSRMNAFINLNLSIYQPPALHPFIASKENLLPASALAHACIPCELQWFQMYAGLFHLIVHANLTVLSQSEKVASQIADSHERHLAVIFDRFPHKTPLFEI